VQRVAVEAFSVLDRMWHALLCINHSRHDWSPGGLSHEISASESFGCVVRCKSSRVARWPVQGLSTRCGVNSLDNVVSRLASQWKRMNSRHPKTPTFFGSWATIRAAGCRISGRPRTSLPAKLATALAPPWELRNEGVPLLRRTNSGRRSPLSLLSTVSFRDQHRRPNRQPQFLRLGIPAASGCSWASES
jgi:hypothetical protein